MKISIISTSLAQTHHIGKKIGEKLEAGTVVRLIGDLGSGKTSLVQGIARGLEVSPEYYITSPTFTLINEYPGRHPFYHVDLYRLADAVDFEDIGLFDILFDEGVVAIEWAEKLTENLKNTITIHLKIIDDQSRIIQIDSFDPKIADILKNLEN